MEQIRIFVRYRCHMTSPSEFDRERSGARKKMHATGRVNAKENADRSLSSGVKYIRREDALRFAHRIASDNTDLMRRLA
ncbi:MULTISPECIES: hypothetical protein [unclassified Cryobacterium]|jgi:hypothetical protein|uniref:hypothetical protein n=1 Tax=unclassified Cryobacterium TaxID=2649013 RepID=UPI0010697D52|nr:MULTISPECIES: hypothetical protein [unclassified Cryobacterium]TFD56472.1 hypothetical protein E3T41_14815 [Cryobacterium sp. Hh38]